MVGYLFLSGEGGISDPFRARVWAEIADKIIIQMQNY